MIGPVYARHRQGDIRWLPADAPYIKLPLQGHLVLNFSISSSYLHPDEGARIRRNMVYQTWLWRCWGRNPDTDSRSDGRGRLVSLSSPTHTPASPCCSDPQTDVVLTSSGRWNEVRHAGRTVTMVRVANQGCRHTAGALRSQSPTRLTFAWKVCFPIQDMIRKHF